MAYELHGLLAGNVSIVTGENIKPSYGGDDEAFLRKIITPIYRVIEQVKYCAILAKFWVLCSRCMNVLWDIPGGKKEQKWESSTLILVQL